MYVLVISKSDKNSLLSACISLLSQFVCLCNCSFFISGLWSCYPCYHLVTKSFLLHFCRHNLYLLCTDSKTSKTKCKIGKNCHSCAIPTATDNKVDTGRTGLLRGQVTNSCSGINHHLFRTVHKCSLASTWTTLVHWLSTFRSKKQQYAATIAVCILNYTYHILLLVYTQTWLFDQQDAHLNPQLQLSGSSNNPPMSSVQTADARGRSQLQTLPEDQETDEFIDIKVALVILPYHKRTYYLHCFWNRTGD